MRKYLNIKTNLVAPFFTLFGRDKFVLTIYSLLVLFGWWVPNDLITDYPKLGLFCDAMARVFPQIDVVTVLGGKDFGLANRFLYSALWLVTFPMILLFAVSCARKILRDGFAPAVRIMSMPEIFAVLIFGAFISWDFFYLAGWIGSTSRLVNAMMLSRFFTAMTAPIYVVASPLFLLSVLFCCYGLLTGRIVFRFEK